eukprot:4342818-Lingulodinium_polyedra.AAC.1
MEGSAKQTHWRALCQMMSRWWISLLTTMSRFVCATQKSEIAVHIDGSSSSSSAGCSVGLGP